jgi:exosortase/archaeosortase family protein
MDSKRVRNARGREKRVDNGLVFSLKFLLTFFLLNFLFFGLFEANVLKRILFLTTIISAHFIYALDVPCVVQTVGIFTISTPGVSLKIVSECTGIVLILAYLSFILWFPGPSIRARFYYGIAGSVGIYGMNILRIVASALIAQWHREYFEIFHNVAFAGSMTLIIIYLWLRFAQDTARKVPRDENLPA